MFTPSRARLFSAFTACLTISGPIPSPGNTAIFMFRSLKKTTGASLSAPAGVFNCNASTEQPGLFDAAFSLERLDREGMLQRDSDLVQTVQQAVLAKGVHLEAEHVTAIGIGDGLGAKADDQAEARKRRDVMEYPVHPGFRQHDRQQAVLETVVVEDVGVTRRDQRAETIVVERPGRVLARRAATEILARHQDIRALVARLVQHEIGVGLAPCRVHARLAMIEISPGVEQIDAETGALDRLQELLRNDRVGIDVGPIQRGDKAFEADKFLHGHFFSSAFFSILAPICFKSLPNPSTVLHPDNPSVPSVKNRTTTRSIMVAPRFHS